MIMRKTLKPGPEMFCMHRDCFCLLHPFHTQGGSIASLITRFGPLEEEVIRVYTRQVLSGARAGGVITI